MKAKQCSYPGCTHVGALWRAVPKLCKTHALMIKAEEKAKDTTQKPVTFTSNSTAKKVEKVYSTTTASNLSTSSKPIFLIRFFR